eukprot:s3385_g2.t1
MPQAACDLSWCWVFHEFRPEQKKEKEYTEGTSRFWKVRNYERACILKHVHVFQTLKLLYSAQSNSLFVDSHPKHLVLLPGKLRLWGASPTFWSLEMDEWMFVAPNATARNQKGELPPSYGYRADTPLGVGFWTETTTQCKVLEKPIVVPSGQDHFQGYRILYAYCAEEGLTQLLEGALPPILPATTKEPSMFPSLEAISENFGAKDPKAAAWFVFCFAGVENVAAWYMVNCAAPNSQFCVPLRVPGELATQVTDVAPGRDIWMVRFDQDLITPFLEAAKTRDAKKLREYLDRGVKGDTVDEDGVSALMMAATEGGAEACEVLLKGGAAVNHAERNNKRTALMFAAQGGHLEAVKTLLAAKADTTQVDSETQTALHWAAVGGRLDTARLLASLGQKTAKNAQALFFCSQSSSTGKNTCGSCGGNETCRDRSGSSIGLISSTSDSETPAGRQLDR